MRHERISVILLALVIQFADAQTRSAQPWHFYRDGRWSVGLRGGGNIWFNDFDRRRLAGDAEIHIRYAFTQAFSLGATGSYAVLQANQQDIFPGTTLQFDYIETKGLSANLIGWLHFSVGRRFSPYIYAGVGGYQYKRKVTGGVPYPDDEKNLSIHIPAGFGAELMFSRYVGFNVDFGVRLLDDNTDFWKGSAQGSTSGGKFDFYATGRVGLTFYFGSSNSDDEDGDGLTNEEERALGLDAYRADTDGDGLGDGEEVNIFKTDPLNPDSDGDGLRDGDEVLIFKTFPIHADTDGDGLPDGDEIVRYKTNPLKKDTDGDGLSDGEEVSVYRTDPLKADTDDDGLSDGDEVLKFKTDPLKADTDGGSVNDGDEVRKGTNPLDPEDDKPKPAEPMEIGQAVILEGVSFASGKSTIERESEEVLLHAVETLRNYPNIKVEIRGFTDNVGSKAVNIQLSQRRADAVRLWLIRHGIVARRLTAKGYGPEFPVADNATSEGRAKNRRIEFFRTY